MNLLISNPVFDGETIEFPLVLAFEYAIKLRNLVSACRSSNFFAEKLFAAITNSDNLILFENLKLCKYAAA